MTPVTEAATLRAIAAWLESHPAATMNFIDRDQVTGGMIALGVLGGRDPSVTERAAEIGDDWEAVGGGRVEWPIMPDAVYRLVDARAGGVLTR